MPSMIDAMILYTVLCKISASLLILYYPVHYQKKKNNTMKNIYEPIIVWYENTELKNSLFIFITYKMMGDPRNVDNTWGERANLALFPAFVEVYMCKRISLWCLLCCREHNKIITQLHDIAYGMLRLINIYISFLLITFLSLLFYVYMPLFLSSYVCPYFCELSIFPSLRFPILYP